MNEFEYQNRKVQHNFLCNRIMAAGQEAHALACEAAQIRMEHRADNKMSREARRARAAAIVLDICLGATAAIGTLAAIGFLTTVVR
jgi:hypothetical protein